MFILAGFTRLMRAMIPPTARHLQKAAVMIDRPPRQQLNTTSLATAAGVSFLAVSRKLAALCSSADTPESSVSANPFTYARSDPGCRPPHARAERIHRSEISKASH